MWPSNQYVYEIPMISNNVVKHNAINQTIGNGISIPPIKMVMTGGYDCFTHIRWYTHSFPICIVIHTVCIINYVPIINKFPIVIYQPLLFISNITTTILHNHNQYWKNELLFIRFPWIVIIILKYSLVISSWTGNHTNHYLLNSHYHYES